MRKWETWEIVYWLGLSVFAAGAVINIYLGYWVYGDVLLTTKQKLSVFKWPNLMYGIGVLLWLISGKIAERK